MEKIKHQLAVLISSVVSMEVKDIQSLIEQPKKRQWGLLSFPVFSLSDDPKNFAAQIASKIKSDFISETTALGGFVNFHFKDSYIKKIFNETFSSESWWSSDEGKNKTIVMDYSSPNVAKYMNVGHLRATAIGQSLVHMARAKGYKVIALNHLGDWGTQFGKLVVAYQEWGKEKTLSHLVDLYVRFHNEAQKNPKLLKRAQETFKEMEEGKHLDLWSSFVSISMDHYKSLWKRLNVHHDEVRGESFYRDKVENVEKILKEKKLLKESEGAQVVFLEDGPPCLIRKSDGASTYSCRDLASIFYRFEKLKASENIYVTGVDHSLHFKQLKEVIKKINPQWFENTLHLGFGMYRFKGKGKLSTREGKSISLEQLMDQSIERVYQIIEEKNPSLKNKQKVAEQVGIGALVFNDLINDRIKDVDFSWDKALNFDGDSGPYVQYCHVRCVSLLNKLNEDEKWKKGIEGEDIDSSELQLMEALLDFESYFHQSFVKHKPHILASYLIQLCHVFSRFYTNCPIIDSPKQNLRVELIKVVQRVLKKGLDLLNIEAPLEM